MDRWWHTGPQPVYAPRIRASRGGTTLKRTYLTILAVALTVSASSCSSAKPIPPDAAPPQPASPAGSDVVQLPNTGDITVTAGLNDPANTSIVVLAYLPDSITVEPGDTVNWTFAGPEPHSVTYAPRGRDIPTPEDADAFTPTKGSDVFDPTALVNSGLLPTGGATPSEFSLTFDSEGDFTFHCVIHPNMVGTVHVKKGAGEDPATISARGKHELSAYLAEGHDAFEALQDVGTEHQANPSGGTNYTVEMGTSTQHTDILAFSPVPLKVKLGDSIRFVDGSQAPHTATFGTVPASAMEAMAATGSSPLHLKSPTAYVSTGLLPPAPPSAMPFDPQAFVFIADAKGSFTYVCLLHESSGMAGTITVS